jgi:signal transduction histidine kinase/CheY-like chemotaxis protein/HPt (histidine-containing phosphotransfer) domain-containing protein
MSFLAHRLLSGVAIALACAAFALTPAGQGFEERYGLDWLFRLRGPVEPPAGVVVVAIDERSAAAMGLPEQPREWPRSRHAQLIDVLTAAGASIIVFDLAFERPQPVPEDSALAAAIARSGRVLLFTGMERERRQAEGGGWFWVERLRRPLPVFASAAFGLAPFPLPTLAGPVRLFWAFLPQSGNRPTLPALALQALALRRDPAWAALYDEIAQEFIGRTPIEQSLADSAETRAWKMTALREGFRQRDLTQHLAARAMSAAPVTDAPAAAWQRDALLRLYRGPDAYYLNFYGPPGSIRHLAYSRVREGEAELAEVLSDAVVFIGYSELAKPSKLDSFQTVFARADGVAMSGVEIAATAYANLLTRRTISPLPPAPTAILILVIGCGFALLTLRLRLRMAVAATLAAGGVYLAIAVVAFSQAAVWLPLATPMLIQLPVALFGGSLVQYASARQRARRLREAKAAADAASRAKSAFVATMSHELRTPMHGVMGFVELLQQTRLDPAQQRLADQAQSSSRSLLHIIDDVLDFSRIEAGGIVLTAEPFDPAELVAATADALRPLATAKQLALTIAVAPGLPPQIEGDPLRLRQILANLIGNAIKFTEAGSIEICVSAVVADATPMLSIAVADTGIGIAPAALARLFQPFTQAEAGTTRRFGGSGLGLSIAQRLAQAMGGGITAVSEEGRGSIFTLRLPAKVVTSAAVDLPRLPAVAAGTGDGGEFRAIAERSDHALTRPSPPVLRATRAGSEIVVAEDDPISRTLISEQLQMLGLGSRLCSDGETAWASLRAAPADVVLSDYHMPGLDGVALAKRLRADPELCHATIIGLTADVLDGSMLACLDAGMDLVLRKPVTIAALHRALVEVGTLAGDGGWAPAHRAVSAPGLADIGQPALAGGADDRLPVFEIANLCEAFGTLDSAALAFVARFAEETRILVEETAAEVAGRRVEAAKRSSHRLAGSCLSVGATRLGHLGRQLEGLLSREAWAEADAAMLTVSGALDELTVAVAALVGDQRSIS